jgi:hypothetical protein
MVHLYVKYCKHSFAPGAKGKIVHLIFLMHLADDPSLAKLGHVSIQLRMENIQ